MLTLYVVSGISKTGKDNQFIKSSSNCSEETLKKLLYEKKAIYHTGILKVSVLNFCAILAKVDPRYISYSP